MGLYNSNSVFAESALSEYSIEDLMNDNSVQAAVEESALDAALRAVTENTYNYNSIMEACAIGELVSLEESGSVDALYVNEAGGFSSFFEAVKKFFQNVWKKIQEIVKRAVMFFNQHSKSDKEFMKKYEKDINKASIKDLSEIDVKFFKYIFYTSDKKYDDALSIAGGADILQGYGVSGKDAFEYAGGANAEDVAKIIKDQYSDEKITDAIEQFRGDVVAKVSGKAAAKVTAGEFTKELKEAFQGGESTADTVKLSEAFGMVKGSAGYLSYSADIKKNLDKALKTSKTGIDKAITYCEKAQTALNKLTSDSDTEKAKAAGKVHELAGKQIKLLKASKDVNVVYVGTAINALKAASSQAKAIIAKAIWAKEPKHEGAFIQTESSASLLDSVKFQ